MINRLNKNIGTILFTFVSTALIALASDGAKPIATSTQNELNSTATAINSTKAQSKSITSYEWGASPQFTVPQSLEKEPATTQNRNLRLALTVDDPSFLKVKEGDKITAGQIVTDNSLERERLFRQRKSIALQIQNLKNKKIPKPVAPSTPKPVNPVPPANYAEEQAAIAQAHMKLTQAVSLLEARSPLLKGDNPERRAEVDKAYSVLQSATQKADEQKQLLQAMGDMKLQSEIIQHEEAKLKALDGEVEQAKSVLLQAQARFNFSATEQEQQLQQLQLAVRLAQSELELAKSRLIASTSRRQLIEYTASVNSMERSQKEQQLQQEYNRASQFYSQAVNDRDYQLAQLDISLSNIEDKLAQIPVVKSPRDGFVRRVKPWIGRDGKYTTTITIADSSSASNKSSNERSNTNSRTKATSTNDNDSYF